MRASLAFAFAACAQGQDQDASSDRCAESVDIPQGKSPEATELYHQLKCYWDSQKTLSGQAQDYYDHLPKQPAIKSFDMMNYAHSSWEDWDDHTIEHIIDWYNETKGIVTIQWHWMAGWYNDRDTDHGCEKRPVKDAGCADFKRDPNCDTPMKGAGCEGCWCWTAAEAAKGYNDSKMIQQIHKDMDLIASKLTVLKNARVPVLWRPLHEARGNGGVDGGVDKSGAWFWWGAAGAEVYKNMWRWMYDKFVNGYQLDNLIWVWADSHRGCPDDEFTGDKCHNEEDWYPDEDKVDIVGVDHYAQSDKFDNDCHKASNWEYYQGLTKCKKMIALTEVGSMPNFTKCFADGIHWLYFLSWGCGDTKDEGCECTDDDCNGELTWTDEDGKEHRGFLSNPEHAVYVDNHKEYIVDVYSMPNVISLEDIIKAEECPSPSSGDEDEAEEDADEDGDSNASTSTTTSRPSLSPEQCHTCLTMCSPCKACTDGPDGTFAFGTCQKCWHCWDWDDDELEDMDQDCDALHGQHAWAEEDVRCLTDERQDCRACYGWSDFLI